MTTTNIPIKLNKEIKIFIIQTTNEILNDPDFGLELTKKAKQRLHKISTGKQKKVSFSEIKERY